MRRRASGLLRLGRKYSPRALHPERSLAEHYNPLAMTPELVKAHDALDREVDKAMGAARKLTSERQRQERLFANYAKLTNNWLNACSNRPHSCRGCGLLSRT